MSNTFRELWEELCGRKTPYQFILLALPVGLVCALCTLAMLFDSAFLTASYQAPRQSPMIRLVTTMSAVSVSQPAPASVPEATPVTLVVASVEHLVRHGETLSAIAQKYCRTDYRQIAKDNGVDPDRIYADRTVLRFQSGCGAKTVVVEAARPSKSAAVSSASRATPQLEREARDVPSRQAPVASVSRMPTLTSSERCEAGLARGYVGAGRARRSLSDREILGCITKAYGHHIREASRLTGLPADVLTAKVFVESRGQKDARHPDGSVGLSQLQPKTAVSYGVPLEKLLDPKENLLGGARILADYVRKAKGDISLGLVYYNAGPNRQFHRHPGFQPEHFPFVQRVARARAKIEQ